MLGPCVLYDRPPCSGGYHLERLGMPLHDLVGINCEKGATTDNQDAGVKYMVKWDVCLMIVWMVSDLTKNCYTVVTPPWWREKVMVLFSYYYQRHDKIQHR